ncbi:MAG TPA: long-chain fatty acid--CoA ligase, partial [Tistrella mobilis]|nr:long-chain fatty acid--CoA ligase [Tistrella mobilis]
MIFDQTMRAERAMSTESIPATDPAPVTDPWPVDEPRSLTLANRTMVEALAATAARLPDRTALFYYGATLDYAGLAAAVERLAAVLVGRFGVRRGDRVLIALQNSP